MELNNQTALVTGGTAGIGRACAKLLAGEGATVVITGRDPERGKAAAAELGTNVRYVQADMSDAESVESLVQQVGDVDILVNNAASFPGALTVDQDVPAFEKTFDTNVRGTYFLAAGLVPGMLERGRGSIVNVTSMVAVKGVPGASVYSSSKAAVESLTRTWAVEFGSRGVRVNSVAPGPTKTEGVEAEWGETNDELGRALPLGRTADPEEIAHAVLFLASPRSSFITGATLHADGGGCGRLNRSESSTQRGTIMPKKYDAAWESALTVVQEVQPPFIPDGAHAMTVVIDYPPGSAGAPPHRHPSGPAFGFMLEGEMLFELEGEPPRVIRAGEAFWEPGGDVIHYSDGNNRDDVHCRFTVTMLCVPGQPMLTLVGDEELVAAQAPSRRSEVSCDVENPAPDDHRCQPRRLGHRSLLATGR